MKYTPRNVIALFSLIPAKRPGFRMLHLWFAFAMSMLLSVPAFSQVSDTILRKSPSDTSHIVHSPRRAAIYSMILPGLGQVYNKKYWKIPIVYAGFGTLGYFINSNNKLYKDFRDAYAYTSNGSVGDPPNSLPLKYAKAQLLTGRDYYRRNLEVSYIITGVWYILNIVDASVDAHFFDYNISDDLSLRVNPWIGPPAPGLGQSGGLMLSMKF